MILALIALALWLLALALLFLGTYWARQHFARKNDRAALTLDQREPVSILKPVKGAEPGLKQNLTTFFRLDYPKFEMLFSVADENDPACDVIRELIAAHPSVDARLLIGDRKIGPNPKVNNLVRSYEEAKYDWILVSDSNVFAPSDYLHQTTKNFTKDVGVVTAVVVGKKPRSLGGFLEAIYLNTFYARWMILAARFGQDCVIGKSMLFRKSTAKRFGGIFQLGRFLAEDYMAGHAMRMLGLKIEMMRVPVQQPLPRYAFKNFWQRHVRWGRIRKAQAPLPIFFEPILGPLLSGALGAFALHRLFGFDRLDVFTSHLAIWMISDLVLQNTLGERPGIRYSIAWILREILAVPLWVLAISGDTVNWRGTQLRIKSGGILETST